MANKFIWQDIYSVGIPSIDAQHKDFFSTTNEIIDLLNRKESATNEQLLAEVMKLVNYANTHFKTEEGYFDKLHYFDAATHEAAHNSYRKRVAYYLEEFAKPEVDTPRMADEIASYSIYWLSDHILQVDKQYTIFFKEHGVK